MLTTAPSQMQVRTDNDMIALRQSVRQAARLVGLGAAQQARFTAAISEVARALLAGVGESEFTIRTAGPPARPALEVICAPPADDRFDASALYSSPNVSGARALVDDASLETGAGCPRLLLRMWLGR